MSFPQIPASKPISLRKAILFESLDSLCTQIPKKPVCTPKVDFSTLVVWDCVESEIVKKIKIVRLVSFVYSIGCYLEMSVSNSKYFSLIRLNAKAAAAALNTE